MAIKKQEFYEGAALHQLARAGNIRSLQYDPPLFKINGDAVLLIKYSGKARSPWPFTFTDAEWSLVLQNKRERVTVGLVCGSDGIAAIKLTDLLTLVDTTARSTHIACYRAHGEHYLVSGPKGEHKRKVPPSLWSTILDEGSR